MKHLTKLRNRKSFNNTIENSNQNQLGKELYVKIWKGYLPIILSAIKCKQKTTTLDRSLFESAGNRKNSGYSFRLDIANGIVPRKSGSTVARDLKKVLDESFDFKRLADEESMTIRLNTNFELIVQVI